MPVVADREALKVRAGGAVVVARGRPINEGARGDRRRDGEFRRSRGRRRADSRTPTHGYRNRRPRQRSRTRRHRAGDLLPGCLVERPVIVARVDDVVAGVLRVGVEANLEVLLPSGTAPIGARSQPVVRVKRTIGRLEQARRVARVRIRRALEKLGGARYGRTGVVVDRGAREIRTVVCAGATAIVAIRAATSTTAIRSPDASAPRATAATDRAAAAAARRRPENAATATAATAAEVRPRAGRPLGATCGGDHGRSHDERIYSPVSRIKRINQRERKHAGLTIIYADGERHAPGD